MIVIIRINGENHSYDFKNYLESLHSGGYHIAVNDLLANWQNELYQVKNISLNLVKDMAYVDVEKM